MPTQVGQLTSERTQLVHNMACHKEQLEQVNVWAERVKQTVIEEHQAYLRTMTAAHLGVSHLLMLCAMHQVPHKLHCHTIFLILRWHAKRLSDCDTQEHMLVARLGPHPPPLLCCVTPLFSSVSSPLILIPLLMPLSSTCPVGSLVFPRSTA